MATYGPGRWPCDLSMCKLYFGNFIVVIMQEKKLVAEIKKTAKTGKEVSLLGS